jgi:hypothetical protein
VIRAVLADHQIAVSVVLLVAVNVVNFCACRQRLAERPLCDQSVYANAAVLAAGVVDLAILAVSARWPIVVPTPTPKRLTLDPAGLEKILLRDRSR